MNDLETMPPPRFPGQPCLTPQRRNIFQEKSRQTARLSADPVSIDLDPFQSLRRSRAAAHARTNHHHFESGVAQRARFLPHPAVQRHGQVLDDDEDGGSAHLRFTICDLRFAIYGERPLIHARNTETSAPFSRGRVNRKSDHQQNPSHFAAKRVSSGQPFTSRSRCSGVITLASSEIDAHRCAATINPRSPDRRATATQGAASWRR